MDNSEADCTEAELQRNIKEALEVLALTVNTFLNRIKTDVTWKNSSHRSVNDAITVVIDRIEDLECYDG